MNENQIIHSFDATFSVNGEISTTEKYRDLYASMAKGHFISRGAGVSYPLASAGEGVRSIVSLQFNRILEFDRHTGIVKVESGISLGKLLKFLSSQGWWLPTIPGHPSITIGGCLAANVHGKSQYHSGLFSEAVREMELYHPKYGKIQCRPQEALFNLTLGGFGLTGHIISASIQCKKLLGKSLIKTSVPCGNIFESIEMMLATKDRYDHVYSWNDLNLTGKAFGAGYVYCEKFDDKEVSDIKDFGCLVTPPRTGVLDSVLSLVLKNQISRIYSLKEKLGPKSQHLGVLSGAFPINGKEVYHRIFGSRGLLESQIIIPHSELTAVLEKLSRAIENFGDPVSLGSLKIFRGPSTYLNYTNDGICLALNVANTTKALWLFKEIDQICIEHGCLPNIAKDSRVSQEVVAKTYAGYDQFKTEILKFDPEKTVQSALRARLGL